MDPLMTLIQLGGAEILKSIWISLNYGITSYTGQIL